MTQSHRSPCAAALALCLCFALAASPLAAAAKVAAGAESPEALVARIEMAAAKGDIAEIAACLAPEDRAEMALGLVLGAGMMIGFMGMGGDMGAAMAEGMGEAVAGQELSAEDKAKLEQGKQEMAKKVAALQKRYDEVLAKHGLADKLNNEAPLEGDPGDPANLAKLFAGVDDVALISDLWGLFKDLGEGENISKSGPLADGAKITDLKVQGDRATAKAGDEAVELVKIDGRWYAKAPQKKEDAGE